jgi:alkanesulfonate monooxygenase SsuD/methylene tetrahydromethanopterin reductase-like flavin-dependent oxidoreductase (luciferase family)
MQFWSGTPFMETADALAVARMLDECGYDGVICADHLNLSPQFAVAVPVSGQSAAVATRDGVA